MADYSGTEELEVMAEAVNYNRYLATLVLAHAMEGDRVLDIGAGIGTFARALAARGHDVRCVEPDPRQAESIRMAGLEVCTDVAMVGDGSIDFIYSLNVLEHIEDDVAALRQWRSKLAPGGRMLLYVPAFQVLFSSMDRKVRHFRRYTRRDLEGKVRVAGFEVTESRYADSLGFLATLLYKMIGSGEGSINRRALVAYDRFAFPLSRLGDRVAERIFGKNVVLTARRAS